MNHIIQSIREINDSGVPEGKGSRKYLVEFQDNFYPPTYLISVANKIVNGEILDIDTISLVWPKIRYMEIMSLKK